jgi:hypothetical protein
MLVATVIMMVGVSGLCAYLLSMKTWSNQEKLRSALKFHALEIADELKGYAADKPLPLPGAPGLNPLANSRRLLLELPGGTDLLGLSTLYPRRQRPPAGGVKNLPWSTHVIHRRYDGVVNLFRGRAR